MSQDFHQCAEGTCRTVQGDIAFDPAAMQAGHDLRELSGVKILRAGAGIKTAFQPEIDGICAVFDGSANAVTIACRAEQLGLRGRIGDCVVRTDHSFNVAHNVKSCNGLGILFAPPKPCHSGMNNRYKLPCHA